MTFRTCVRCHVDKSIEEFRTYQSGRRRRRTCRGCERATKQQSGVYDNTPERLEQMRRSRFLREYGITLEEYDEMVSIRQGRCDICGELPSDNRGSKLHVDHVEGTKRVRGLLCLRCNVGIGMLRHNRRIIASAHRYLKM